MPHYFLKILIGSAALLVGIPQVFSQRTTRVVVVDSLTFEALPAVFVQVKNTTRAFLAEPTGIFTLQTRPADTLLISHIGYHDALVPLMFEEDALMIRMRPKITLLDEAVIVSRKLYPSELNPRISALPKTRTLMGSLADPWEYFNKKQKEKRKLVKLMLINDRVKTFMEVITDPSIKEELMEGYSLADAEYYNILVKFNRQNFPVIYSNDSEKIIEALHSFFERETR
ncbi:MAG TPA: hypothetical protein VFM90_02305 [Cyclobacteriaceae bacterium]|nr:hypothetical protein [Cyclobacteriaceae bacterium]